MPQSHPKSVQWWWTYRVVKLAIFSCSSGWVARVLKPLGNGSPHIVASVSSPINDHIFRCSVLSWDFRCLPVLIAHKRLQGRHGRADNAWHECIILQRRISTPSLTALRTPRSSDGDAVLLLTAEFLTQKSILLTYNCSLHSFTQMPML